MASRDLDMCWVMEGFREVGWSWVGEGSELEVGVVRDASCCSLEGRARGARGSRYRVGPKGAWKGRLVGMQREGVCLWRGNGWGC